MVTTGNSWCDRRPRPGAAKGVNCRGTVCQRTLERTARADRLVEILAQQFTRQDFRMVPPKYDLRFGMVPSQWEIRCVWSLLNLAQGSVWTHLNGTYSSVWSHLRFPTQSANSIFPQFGISVDHCYYARRATTKTYSKQQAVQLILLMVNIHTVKLAISHNTHHCTSHTTCQTSNIRLGLRSVHEISLKLPISWMQPVHQESLSVSTKLQKC